MLENSWGTAEAWLSELHSDVVLIVLYWTLFYWTLLTENAAKFSLHESCNGPALLEFIWRIWQRLSTFEYIPVLGEQDLLVFKTLKWANSSENEDSKATMANKPCCGSGNQLDLQTGTGGRAGLEHLLNEKMKEVVQLELFAHTAMWLHDREASSNPMILLRPSQEETMEQVHWNLGMLSEKSLEG